MSLDAERIVFVCVSLTSALGLAVSLGLVVVNVKHRNDRLVKMSSPMINILMLLGAILLYSTNIMYGLASLWPLAHRLWAWLLPVSFSLLFGCLFAKSWRVNRIFTNPHRTKTVIKDVQLVLMTGTLVLVDVVILTVWEVLESATKNQPHAENEILSDSDESHVTRPPPINDQNRAEAFAHAQYTPNCTVIFVTLLLLYKGVYLMYGAYLAWAIRHVTIPPMDDSCCILVASHVTVISGCLAISATSVLEAFPVARYACFAASVWLSTTVTLTLEFAPKIHYWFKHQNDEFLKMTLSPCVNQSASPAQHTPRSAASDSSSRTTCDENSSKTELEEVVTGNGRSAISALQETPSRPLADLIRTKHDSPDSGHDSPRSAVSPQTEDNNIIMYRIEDDIDDRLPTHPPLQKSCSEGSGSNHAASDLYDFRMDSHMTRRRMYYDYLRRNRGLATQIRQTYDLDSDSDTMTYISHCLSPSQSLASMPGRTLTNELWTLENDVFYPRRQQRNAKRVKRKSRSQRTKMASQCHELGRGSSASVV